MGLRKVGDFGPESLQELEQFSPVFRLHRLRFGNPAFEFSDGILNHTFLPGAIALKRRYRKRPERKDDFLQTTFYERRRDCPKLAKPIPARMILPPNALC